MRAYGDTQRSQFTNQITSSKLATGLDMSKKISIISQGCQDRMDKATFLNFPHEIWPIEGFQQQYMYNAGKRLERDAENFIEQPMER